MANIKRAVSPLIATILLVALTVSIGAMVIGWGRQYVQQQTGCLGYKLDLHGAKYNPNGIQIEVMSYNSGTQRLYINDTIAKIIDRNGRSWTCFPSGTYGGATGCRVEKFSSGEDILYIEPGKAAQIIVKAGDSNLQNSVVGGYIWIEVRGCGRISENIIIE